MRVTPRRVEPTVSSTCPLLRGLLVGAGAPLEVTADAVDASACEPSIGSTFGPGTHA